jgi:hypothetical protein
MYPHIPLLVFLCAQMVSPTIGKQASSLSITQRLHNIALQHSAGLAADLRVALGDVLLTRRQQSNPERRGVYCVSTKNGGGAQVPFGNGTGTTTAARTATTARTTATSPTSSSGGSIPSSTSNWRLAESHVCNFFGYMVVGY